MNHQFLRNHLLDFEVLAALALAGMAHFYFAFGWVVSALLGLSAFVVIPLLVRGWFELRAIFFASRFRD